MNKYLSISKEVQEALNAGKPVVALESTIISHGMPYPQNVETALQVEQTIRETDRRRKKQIEYNKLHHITPKQVEVKQNVLAGELTSRGGKPVARGLANGTTGRVSAPNSYDDPTYIPNPSDLGRGVVSVGFGHDSHREAGAAFRDGHVAADLAAVLQDPVIRSMSREQIEKMVEEDRRRMKKSAAELDFAQAAQYRDEMWALQEYLKVWKDR